MKQLGNQSGIGAAIRCHKKLAIITSTCVVVFIGVAVYGWLSVTSWSFVESQSVVARQEITASLKQAVALPVSSSDERAKKVTAFQGIEEQIDSYQNMCQISPLVQRQSAISSLRAKQDICQSTLKQLDTTRVSLSAVTDFLHDEQAVALLVATAGSLPGELNEGSWQDVAVKWHVLAEKLSALKVSAHFEPVHKRLITESAHMNASWQEVLAAHAAKDRARYEKAIDELSKSYGSFKDVTQLTTDTIMPLMREFQTNYDSIVS